MYQCLVVLLAWHWFEFCQLGKDTACTISFQPFVRYYTLVKWAKITCLLMFLDLRQRRQCHSVLSVRSWHTFLGIRSLVLSETLAQVRGPGMQESGIARFLGKLYFGPFWDKNATKLAFLPVSRNLCQNVLRKVTNQIAPFVSLGKHFSRNPFISFFWNFAIS